MKTINFQIITKDFTLDEEKEYLAEIAAAAVKSSADVLQLRNKNISPGNLYRCALFIKKTLKSFKKKRKPLLIINDRPDVAYISGADGVHVGQEDFPAAEIKKIFPNLIVGVSAETVEQAVAAQNDGADYIGAGPVYLTSSKQDAGDLMAKETLKKICRSVNIPVIAIGGITEDKIKELAPHGVSGAAVISAVSRAPYPASAALKFRKNIDKFLKDEVKEYKI